MLPPGAAGDALMGLSLGAGGVGGHQYPEKASVNHGLTVNCLEEPLGLLQAVANNVKNLGVWAKIHAQTRRRPSNNQGC